MGTTRSLDRSERCGEARLGARQQCDEVRGEGYDPTQPLRVDAIDVVGGAVVIGVGAGEEVEDRDAGSVERRVVGWSVAVGEAGSTEAERVALRSPPPGAFPTRPQCPCR